MTKESFLTTRWNNLLAVGLGLPALIYVVTVLATTTFSDKTAFIGIAIIGVVY